MKNHAQQQKNYFKTTTTKIYAFTIFLDSCTTFIFFFKAVPLHKMLVSWEAPKLGTVEFWVIDDT